MHPFILIWKLLFTATKELNRIASKSFSDSPAKKAEISPPILEVSNSDRKS